MFQKGGKGGGGRNEAGRGLGAGRGRKATAVMVGTGISHCLQQVKALSQQPGMWPPKISRPWARFGQSVGSAFPLSSLTVPLRGSQARPADQPPYCSLLFPTRANLLFSISDNFFVFLSLSRHTSSKAVKIFPTVQRENWKESPCVPNRGPGKCKRHS